MDKILLSPPVVFLIMFVFLVILGALLKRLAFRVKKEPSGLGEPYACGEDVPDQLAQPDYSQFFPYAFYFTIAHVATLMITTVPVDKIGSLALPFIYIGSLVIGLFVLLRRE